MCQPQPKFSRPESSSCIVSTGQQRIEEAPRREVGSEGHICIVKQCAVQGYFALDRFLASFSFSFQFFSKWGWSPARLQSTDSCWSKDCKEFNSADDLFLPGHWSAPTIMQFFIPMTRGYLEQKNIFTQILLRMFLTLDSQRIGGWRWWWGQWWCGVAKWL